MNLRNKYIFVCALIFLFFPIIYSTLSSDNITATDWIYRHSVWIDRYVHGDFTPILAYTPLFHWMMLPFVLINFPMKYFQIMFAVLSTFGILYYVHKTENENTLIYTSILLASSIAFVEFSSALMPQSLDYFIFPLIILAYFRNKIGYMITGLMAIFLMHGTGFIFVVVLLMHSITTKRYKIAKILLIILLLMLPIFYYYQFIPSIDSLITFWDVEAQNAWEMQYINPFWNFFFFSGFLTWILLPYASYKLYKNRKLYDEKLLLYALWILGFVPLIIFQMGFWRFISYAIVPLSLFVASIMGKDLSEKNEITKRFDEVFG